MKFHIYIQIINSKRAHKTQHKHQKQQMNQDAQSQKPRKEKSEAENEATKEDSTKQPAKLALKPNPNLKLKQIGEQNLKAKSEEKSKSKSQQKRKKPSIPSNENGGMKKTNIVVEQYSPVEVYEREGSGTQGRKPHAILGRKKKSTETAAVPHPLSLHHNNQFLQHSSPTHQHNFNSSQPNPPSADTQIHKHPEMHQQFQEIEVSNSTNAQQIDLMETEEFKNIDIDSLNAYLARLKHFNQLNAMGQLSDQEFLHLKKLNQLNAFSESAAAQEDLANLSNLNSSSNNNTDNSPQPLYLENPNPNQMIPKFPQLNMGVRHAFLNEEQQEQLHTQNKLENLELLQNIKNMRNINLDPNLAGNSPPGDGTNVSAGEQDQELNEVEQRLRQMEMEEYKEIEQFRKDQGFPPTSNFANFQNPPNYDVNSLDKFERENYDPNDFYPQGYDAQTDDYKELERLQHLHELNQIQQMKRPFKQNELMSMNPNDGKIEDVKFYDYERLLTADDNIHKSMALSENAEFELTFIQDKLCLEEILSSLFLSFELNMAQFQRTSINYNPHKTPTPEQLKNAENLKPESQLPGQMNQAAEGFPSEMNQEGLGSSSQFQGGQSPIGTGMGPMGRGRGVQMMGGRQMPLNPMGRGMGRGVPQAKPKSKTNPLVGMGIGLQGVKNINKVEIGEIGIKNTNGKRNYAFTPDGKEGETDEKENINKNEGKNGNSMHLQINMNMNELKHINKINKLVEFTNSSELKEKEKEREGMVGINDMNEMNEMNDMNRMNEIKEMNELDRMKYLDLDISNVNRPKPKLRSITQPESSSSKPLPIEGEANGHQPLEGDDISGSFSNKVNSSDIKFPKTSEKEEEEVYGKMEEILRSPEPEDLSDENEFKPMRGSERTDSQRLNDLNEPPLNLTFEANTRDLDSDTPQNKNGIFIRFS